MTFKGKKNWIKTLGDVDSNMVICESKQIQTLFFLSNWLLTIWNCRSLQITSHKNFITENKWSYIPKSYFTRFFLCMYTYVRKSHLSSWIHHLQPDNTPRIIIISLIKRYTMANAGIIIWERETEWYQMGKNRIVTRVIIFPNGVVSSSRGSDVGTGERARDSVKVDCRVPAQRLLGQSEAHAGSRSRFLFYSLTVISK